MTEKEYQASKENSVAEKSPCNVTYFIEEQSFKGTSLHFTERGILVNCPQPAPLNTKVKLILQFPGFKNPVELQGEVVWTNIHGPADTISPRGMGVKFANVDRDTERLLADLAGQYESLSSMYTCYFT